MRKVIAFVFARGGSKGLPGKNIKMLGGKPLIAYPIELARSADFISEVYVSTDCPDIARVAAESGAKVIVRPAALAQDNSPEWAAWQHGIDQVLSLQGDFDVFLSLPATSPLRSIEDVRSAVVTLESTSSDICIGITPASRNPYFNMVKYGEGGGLEIAVAGGGNFSRRQDAPKMYDITTVVYASSPRYIKAASGLFDGKVCGVVVPRERSIDIDDQFDFDVAEFLVGKGREGGYE